jgi:hypothetical protein
VYNIYEGVLRLASVGGSVAGCRGLIAAALLTVRGLYGLRLKQKEIF